MLRESNVQLLSRHVCTHSSQLKTSDLHKLPWRVHDTRKLYQGANNQSLKLSFTGNNLGHQWSNTSVRQQQAADACRKLAILCTTVELWRQNLHQSDTSDATKLSVAPPPEWWDCTMYCAAKAADAKMCQGQTAVGAANKTAKKS